jgi:hypothetical protein
LPSGFVRTCVRATIASGEIAIITGLGAFERSVSTGFGVVGNTFTRGGVTSLVLCTRLVREGRRADVWEADFAHDIGSGLPFVITGVVDKALACCDLKFAALSLHIAGADFA